jgi:hypothetical protein
MFSHAGLFYVSEPVGVYAICIKFYRTHRTHNLGDMKC